MDFTENAKNYHAPMHTAEHILNQTMVRMFGIERSFSNHIERKKSKCDYRFERDLTQDEVIEINRRVNEMIAMNLDVSEEFLELKEAQQKFSTTKLPESAGNTIRVINVGDYDSCLCSGEHVKNTSEIGVFAISTHSYENGVLRIRYKLGQ
jgi:misacylated tRNA(Ala) deacylase